ncbi:hypothetical protein JCM14469_02230 [Desulfatiferula olefinivorans]
MRVRSGFEASIKNRPVRGGFKKNAALEHERETRPELEIRYVPKSIERVRQYVFF